MPISEWGETEFNEAYSAGYNKSTIGNWAQSYIGSHTAGLSARGWLNGKVLFVGCGFGYWLEAAIEYAGLDPANVWGIDTSSYIQANKSDPAFCSPAIAPKILNYDIHSSQVLNQLKAHYGGSGRVNGPVISTLVLTSLDETEHQAFSDALNTLAGNGPVIHVFTSDLPGQTGKTPTSAAMNWQSRAYWETTPFANDWLVDVQNGWAVRNPNTGEWL